MPVKILQGTLLHITIVPHFVGFGTASRWIKETLLEMDVNTMTPPVACLMRLNELKRLAEEG